MKNVLKSLVVLGLVSVLSAGCSQRLGNFTVLSTKNTELGKKYVRVTADNEKAKGADTKSIIVFIPMGTPNLQEAADKALEKFGAQVLTDVVVYYDYYYIPYIYGEMKYRVEGQAWKQVDDLQKKVQNDLKKADEVYTLTKVDGKLEFVATEKSAPVLKTIH